MTIGEFDDDPSTVPDGTAIPADRTLEAPFSADEVTPAPSIEEDGCRWCVRAVARIRDDVAPPGCERQARAYADLGACIGTQDRRWGLCAAKMIFWVGDFEWYFGNERRTAAVAAPPAGISERRARIPPPPPGAHAVPSPSD